MFIHEEKDALVQQAALAGAAGAVASKASFFSGAGTAMFGAFTGEYLFAAIGALCTVLTWVVNAYYKRKRWRLELRRVEFEMEMARAAEERRTQEARVRMQIMRETGQVAHVPDTNQQRLSRFADTGEERQ